MRSVLVSIMAFFSACVFASCQVPQSLEGLTFINYIDPSYSQENPNAGALEQGNYTADEYVVRFLNRDIGPFKGLYKYKVLDEKNGIGFYQGFEKKPMIKPSHSVLFKCLTNSRGLAIFTQEKGINEPFTRQNTFIYTISPASSRESAKTQ